MNATSKGVLLAIAAYVVTIGVVLFVVFLAIMVVMAMSLSCGAMSRALLVVWAAIAAVCLASVAVVVLVTRKQMAGGKARTLVVTAYAAAMLASFAFFAFGVMVLFNC